MCRGFVPRHLPKAARAAVIGKYKWRMQVRPRSRNEVARIAPRVRPRMGGISWSAVRIRCHARGLDMKVRLSVDAMRPRQLYFSVWVGRVDPVCLRFHAWATAPNRQKPYDGNNQPAGAQAAQARHLQEP